MLHTSLPRPPNSGSSRPPRAEPRNERLRRLSGSRSVRITGWASGSTLARKVQAAPHRGRLVRSSHEPGVELGVCDAPPATPFPEPDKQSLVVAVTRCSFPGRTCSVGIFRRVRSRRQCGQAALRVRPRFGGLRRGGLRSPWRWMVAIWSVVENGRCFGCIRTASSESRRRSSSSSSCPRRGRPWTKRSCWIWSQVNAGIL